MILKDADGEVMPLTAKCCSKENHVLNTPKYGDHERHVPTRGEPSHKSRGVCMSAGTAHTSVPTVPRLFVKTVLHDFEYHVHKKCTPK
jgi:hypothetical protein